MAEDIGEFLKYFVDRFDRPQDQEILNRLSETVARLDVAIGHYAIISEKLGAIMARADEHAARIGSAIEANTQQASKAFGEIRKALDEALESQITQAELDAAVAAAKTAAAEEANAANTAALDAAFAPMQAKLDAQKAALQQLDDIVPDAPPTPPTEPPVEPPPTEPTTGEPVPPPVEPTPQP